MAVESTSEMETKRIRRKMKLGGEKSKELRRR